MVENTDGESAFELLEESREALEWRLALCDLATESIDAQYYIWQSDETGTLLFLRLMAAADRGVRVRLLVDDLALAASDRDLASLCAHPNLEIRLFNAGAARRGYVGPAINFLTNFRELNRRMHNKLFVADSRVAIVGGRNIGNEYFGLSKKYNFHDLDVLTAGPVVPEISGAFDDYWNHETAYPGQELSGRGSSEKARQIREEMAELLDDSADLLAAYPLEARDWQPELLNFARNSHRGEARFLQDDPVKIAGKEVRLVDMIEYLATPSNKEILAVTPYMIPVPGFLEDLEALAKDGVAVKILTGSMESNNHTIAHSHYKKYRRSILETGAHLVEYRGQPGEGERRKVDVEPVRGDFVSLHVKTLVGDRRRCFIGSLNLDPRAVVINTENGLLIESAGLSRELAAEIDTMSNSENAWSVTTNERGQLRWTSSAGVRSIQPARGLGQRAADFFFRLLPIESQL